MHQPTNPHPWQPTPPVRKRAPWKTIGITVGGILALCCGGFLAIGILADPPANKATTAAEQAAGQPPPPTLGTSTPKGQPATSAAPTKPSRTPSRNTTSKPAVAPKTTKPKPAPTTTRPKPKPTTQAPEPVEVYYKNCTAVRAADADPIRRGDPGYGRHLDRDGDGVGCE